MQGSRKVLPRCPGLKDTPVAHICTRSMFEFFSFSFHLASLVEVGIEPDCVVASGE